MVKLGGRLCKPLIPRECDFYQLIRKDFPQLIPFTAEFFGSVSLKKKIGGKGERERGGDLPDVAVSGIEYIVLQDLTAGMVKPCVMDVKMGTRQRFTTSTTLGFRLCGMRVWRGDGLYTVDRLYGRTLTSSSVSSAMEEYLFDGYTTRTELIPSILNSLERLLDVMEECPCRLYTSSLLFTYEGGDEHTHPVVDIRIVDFAHGISKNSKEGELDDGFVFGLKNLIILFQSISNKYNNNNENNNENNNSIGNKSLTNINYQPKDKTISCMEKTGSRCAPFMENNTAQKVIS